MLNQIESSSTRISDLVSAIKEYTFMDQAPIQNVDIVRTRSRPTLTILNHKLKGGVTVQRDYQKIPFLVNSFGSELNQVWTNIIDNAIDAMGGKGELRVRTYREDNCVVVEIADNGPEFHRRSSPTFLSLSSRPKEWERELLAAKSQALRGRLPSCHCRMSAFVKMPNLREGHSLDVWITDPILYDDW